MIEVERRTCLECNGHGGHEVYAKWHVCSTCGGSGMLLFDRCRSCSSLHNQRPAPRKADSDASPSTEAAPTGSTLGTGEQ